jgi:hypothetical protein
MQSESLPPVVLDAFGGEEAEKARLERVDLEEVLKRYSPYQAWCTFLRGPYNFLAAAPPPSSPSAL